MHGIHDTRNVIIDEEKKTDWKQCVWAGVTSAKSGMNTDTDTVIYSMLLFFGEFLYEFGHIKVKSND